MLLSRILKAETLGSLLTFNLVTVMKRFKSILFAILGLLCVFALLAGIKFDQILTMIESGETFVPPPEYVSTFSVEQQSWPNTYNAIGTVLADEGIVVAAELNAVESRFLLPCARRRALQRWPQTAAAITSAPARSGITQTS